MTTLNKKSGVITSPFHPRKYPNNQECRWQITASKGNYVVLIIEREIKQCGASCTCDYLEIRDGVSSDGASSRRRCGYKHVAYFSIFESLKVRFVSDDSSTKLYAGFNSIYTQVNYSGFPIGEQ